MSLETRCNSAQFKRAEQLRRWEDSDTNREPCTPNQKSRKIKFTSGCIFLAACAASDKDEVLKLLEKGADINTANVDGLTALHQACIDDNFDMVEFLVEHGADVNRGDNEGWTALHATASCGFLYIAKYLIEKGANVAAVNNDDELPIDIADESKMKDLLASEIKKRGIDCEEARNEEKRIMLSDAKEWLRSKSVLVNVSHPKNQATALHVAAAKGYSDVAKILLQCGADVDCQDVDGWTPLHAAAHWGQEDVCNILVENFADLESTNFVGQTPFDLADADMFRYLESLKKKQNKEEVMNRRQAKKRLEIQDRTIETETPIKVKKVEVKIEKDEKQDNIEMEVSETESETESSSETESNSTNDEKNNLVNRIEANRIESEKSSDKTLPPSEPPKQLDANNDDNLLSWRRQNARQTKVDSVSNKPTDDKFSSNSNVNNDNEIILRRTQSEKEFMVKNDSHANTRPSSDSHHIIPYSSRSYSYKYIDSSNQLYDRCSKEDSCENINSATTPNATSSVTTSPVPNTLPQRSDLKLQVVTTPSSINNTSTPTTPGGTRLQMFKNFFKSFVPPVRDEESETQRKAHAKRVRETRRSTQGVTLEEIKSAEQLVKQKNQSNNNNNNEQSGSNGDSSNGVSVSATITTATSTVSRESEEPIIMHERRPSWRLRIDSSSSKFKLEDASKPASEPPSTPSYTRRNTSTNPTSTATTTTTTTTQNPRSSIVESVDATITLPLRRPKPVDDREQDKENDVRNAQGTLATQAAIQRRKRPKRRSTGVVNFENIDDLEHDKEQSEGAGGDQKETSKTNQESGPERSSRSRLSSTSDIRNENGEIDYKKLYEQAIAENSELKDKMKKNDQELRETKTTLEKLVVVHNRNSVSELEKRERRAMERKLSEMEEELKHMEKIRIENQKLKDENGALIRVISKLSK